MFRKSLEKRFKREFFLRFTKLLEFTISYFICFNFFYNELLIPITNKVWQRMFKKKLQRNQNHELLLHLGTGSLRDHWTKLFSGHKACYNSQWPNNCYFKPCLCSRGHTKQNCTRPSQVTTTPMSKGNTCITEPNLEVLPFKDILVKD